MIEAISSNPTAVINPFANISHGMEITGKDGVRRREQAQAPSDDMIESSLQKRNAFDTDISIYPMPMPQAGEIKHPQFAAISDYFISRDSSAAPSSRIQTSNTEQARFERQLSESAVDLIAGKEDDIGKEECQPLTDLCEEIFLSLHARISMTKFHAPSLQEPRFQEPSEAGDVGDVSSAARQLAQWTQESDIGLEILRMFIATWDQIRHSLRTERQFEIGELRRLSEQAVAELIKQGQDKFQQDALNAWASIASSVVQLAPIGIHTAIKAYKAKSSNTLTFNLGEEAGRAAQDSEYVKATRRQARAHEFGNILQISRAFGEGVQGIINLFAAYCGLDAAKDNAAYTRFSNEIQIKIMEIENLNTRGEDAWQKIMQILGSLLQRQDRLYELNVRNTRA
ncbi:MAG TPA: hypothetical protein VGN04_12250 [Herbaspirillum sp.]